MSKRNYFTGLKKFADNGGSITTSTGKEYTDYDKYADAVKFAKANEVLSWEGHMGNKAYRDSMSNSISNFNDEHTTTGERGMFDRVLGMTGYNGLAEAFYNATDNDKSTSFLGGFGQGISNMNPLNDNAQNERHSWSDVLDNLGWKDSGLSFSEHAKKVGTELGSGNLKDSLKSSLNMGKDWTKFLAGLTLDIVTDPLSYVGVGAIGATAKAVKGTGYTLKDANRVMQTVKNVKGLQDVAAYVKNPSISVADKITSLKGISLEQMKNIINKNNNARGILSAEDALTDYAKTVHRMKFGEEGITASLGNLPLVDRKAHALKTIVSGEKIREIGDRTISPYWNSLTKAIRTSRIGQKFSRLNPIEAMADTEKAAAWSVLNKLEKSVIKSDIHIEDIEFAQKLEDFQNSLTEGEKNTFIDMVETGTLDDHLKWKDTVKAWKDKGLNVTHAYDMYGEKKLSSAKKYLLETNHVAEEHKKLDDVVNELENKFVKDDTRENMFHRITGFKYKKSFSFDDEQWVYSALRDFKCDEEKNVTRYLNDRLGTLEDQLRVAKFFKKGTKRLEAKVLKVRSQIKTFESADAKGKRKFVNSLYRSMDPSVLFDFSTIYGSMKDETLKTIEGSMFDKFYKNKKLFEEDLVNYDNYITAIRDRRVFEMTNDWIKVSDNRSVAEDIVGNLVDNKKAIWELYKNCLTTVNPYSTKPLKMDKINVLEWFDTNVEKIAKMEASFNLWSKYPTAEEIFTKFENDMTKIAWDEFNVDELNGKQAVSLRNKYIMHKPTTEFLDVVEKLNSGEMPKWEKFKQDVLGLIPDAEKHGFSGMFGGTGNHKKSRDLKKTIREANEEFIEKFKKPIFSTNLSDLYLSRLLHSHTNVWNRKSMEFVKETIGENSGTVDGKFVAKNDDYTVCYTYNDINKLINKEVAKMIAVKRDNFLIDKAIEYNHNAYNNWDEFKEKTISIAKQKTNSIFSRARYFATQMNLRDKAVKELNKKYDIDHKVKVYKEDLALYRKRCVDKKKEMHRFYKKTHQKLKSYVDEGILDNNDFEFVWDILQHPYNNSLNRGFNMREFNAREEYFEKLADVFNIEFEGYASNAYWFNENYNKIRKEFYAKKVEVNSYLKSKEYLEYNEKLIERDKFNELLKKATEDYEKSEINLKQIEDRFLNEWSVGKRLLKVDEDGVPEKCGIVDAWSKEWDDENFETLWNENRERFLNRYVGEEGSKERKLFTANMPFQKIKNMEEFAKRFGEENYPLQYPNTVINDWNVATKAQRQAMQKDITNVFDHFLHVWKLNHSILSPSFHIQNTIGNAFSSYLALTEGYMNPKKLLRAINVLSKPNLDDVITLNGKKYSTLELEHLARTLGVIDESFVNVEFEKGLGTLQYNLMGHSWQRFKDIKWKGSNSLNPFNNNDFIPYQFFGTIGTNIETTQRLNLFLCAMEDGNSAEEAAKMVDEYMFDYSDLTDFEQDVLKRIVPFYTYTRKAIPMMLKSICEKNYKWTPIVYGIRDTNESGTGVELADGTRYMDDKLTIPGEKYSFNPNMWGALAKLNNPVAYGEAMLNPAIKAPLEASIGHNGFGMTDTEGIGDLFSNSLVSDVGDVVNADSGIDVWNALTGLKIKEYKEYKSFDDVEISEDDWKKFRDIAEKERDRAKTEVSTRNS